MPATLHNWNELLSDEPTHDWNALLGESAGGDSVSSPSNQLAGSPTPADDRAPTNRFARLQEIHNRIKEGDDSPELRQEREAERTRLQAEYEGENRNFITKSLPYRTLETAAKGIKAGNETIVADTILAALNPMRAHVDYLSRKLIDSGVVDSETELGVTIEQNLGTYVTRT